MDYQSFSTADLIILLCLLLAAITGLIRGFLRELISLGAWLVAFIVALILIPVLQRHLPAALPEPARTAVAIILPVVVTLLILAPVGALLRRAAGIFSLPGCLPALILTLPGRIAGAVTGVLRVLMIITGAFVLILHGYGPATNIEYRSQVLLPHFTGMARRVLIYTQDTNHMMINVPATDYPDSKSVTGSGGL